MARISVAGVLLAALSLVPAAQATDPWVIANISAVALNMRQGWCSDQWTSCGFLCGPGGNQTATNSCDHGSLRATCDCKDGSSPDLKSYLRTLPTRMCEWNFEACLVAAPPDNTWNCAKDIKAYCGTREPNPAAVATSVSSSAISTSTTVNIPFSPTTTASLISPTPELGPIIGGAVSGLLVIVAAVAGFFYWLGRRSRRRRQRQRDDRERRSRSPHRDHSPSPPSVIEYHGKEVSGGIVAQPAVGRETIERASTSVSEATSGNSDDLKTLVTEKRPGHEMVQDLTESPVVQDMYFDTAKYRMPPPVKPS